LPALAPEKVTNSGDFGGGYAVWKAVFDLYVYTHTYIHTYIHLEATNCSRLIMMQHSVRLVLGSWQAVIGSWHAVLGS
jgi:hypothetical protein